MQLQHDGLGSAPHSSAGKEEREEERRKERQPASNQIFTRLCENSKQHFQKLQFLFQSKLHLSYGLEENLKFQKLGLEGLVIV